MSQRCRRVARLWGGDSFPSSKTSHRGFCICVPSSSGVRSEETIKFHTTSKVNACSTPHFELGTAPIWNPGSAFYYMSV